MDMIGIFFIALAGALVVAAAVIGDSKPQTRRTISDLWAWTLNVRTNWRG